jgi:hypothetical protein
MSRAVGTPGLQAEEDVKINDAYASLEQVASTRRTVMADIGKPQRIIEIPKETPVPETVPAPEKPAEQPKEPTPA